MLPSAPAYHGLWSFSQMLLPSGHRKYNLSSCFPPELQRLSPPKSEAPSQLLGINFHSQHLIWWFHSSSVFYRKIWMCIPNRRLLNSTCSSATYLLFLQFEDLLFHFCNLPVHSIHALYQFFLRKLGWRSILVISTWLTRQWWWWPFMLASKSCLLRFKKGWRPREIQQRHYHIMNNSYRQFLAVYTGSAGKNPGSGTQETHYKKIRRILSLMDWWKLTSLVPEMNLSYSLLFFRVLAHEHAKHCTANAHKKQQALLKPQLSFTSSRKSTHRLQS